MAEVVGSVSQWESEEPEYELRSILIRVPHWMKFTVDFTSAKLEISTVELIRRSLIIQLYLELESRLLLVKLVHESIEQAVLRYYKSNLKEYDSLVNTAVNTSE